MLRVVLIEDSLLVRDALAKILRTLSNVEIAGEAGDVDAGRALIDRVAPDLLIVDIRLPGGSGLDLLHHVRKQSPRTAMAVFTAYPSPQLERRCVEAGARYFLDKDGPLDELLAAVRQVAGEHTP